jgi:hypothetical protein
MSFQPVVPLGGVAGWRFLERTMETQRAAFDAAPARQRDLAHFREAIGRVSSAAELVADRQLLSVALGAFGLDGDVDNRFFIRKVLEEGTADRDALANKLTDRRYRDLAAAFGFGNGQPPRAGRPGFADEIAAAYLVRQFEIAVGDGDQSMRLALTLDRALPDIAGRAVADDTKWLTVMGDPPLRKVFETALGLPSAFGALDLDRQLADFKARAERVFGVSDFAELASPEMQDEVLRTFLARAQLTGDLGAPAPSAPALAILAGADRGALFSALL